MPSLGTQLSAAALLTDIRSRYRFGALVEPRVGLIDSLRFLPIELGAPEVEVAGAALGNVSRTLPYLNSQKGHSGTGADVDPEFALIRAVAEAAERYACMVFADRDFVVATAQELGANALDLTEIPRCSQAELRDTRCPVTLPRSDAPIRWLRGYSLVHQCERFVPAVMTHLYLRAWAAERFWLQISTGVAAHTSLQQALVAAICETVERDAIALLWLGRVPLPRIERPQAVQGPAATLFERIDASGIQYLDFDATTDMGIPTVFSVQVDPGHPYCALSVSCATAINPEEAQVKARREACVARLGLNKPQEIPAEVIDFNQLIHGAHYYGRGGHEADFDFLLKGAGGTTTLAAMCEHMPSPPDMTDDARLALVLARLRSLDLDAIAVDLTTDELRDVGLWVVRVIIPQLMPISFVRRARYLGTPRLYDYVGRVKQSAFTEEDVNPGPMPFA
jgi:ribosomal protein S12 methylthiotransferase accessory factor